MTQNLYSHLQSAKQIVSAELANIAEPVVYEAGCGSDPVYAEAVSTNAKIIGVDLDPSQLARNKRNTLSILANVEEFSLTGKSIDLVVCFDLLEHLPNPDKAIKNFDHCLRDGGLVLLAFPNLHSLKGLVTKYTPYFVHKMFYRFIIGDTSALTNEGRQYATELNPGLTPNKVRDFFLSNNYAPLIYSVYEGPVPEHMRKKNRLFGMLFDITYAVGMIATLGKIDLRQSDTFMLFKKA